MIEGIVLMLVGAALMITVPTIRNVEHRRSFVARLIVAEPIADAIPLAPREPDLDRLAREADAALESSLLSRGVSGLAQVYARAARPRR